MSFWYCNTCLCNIPHGEYVFNCTICLDYDQCEQCHEAVESCHSHPMVRELAFGCGKIIENHSNDTASFILNAIDIYSDRHCFGVRDTNNVTDETYANSYSWLTFQNIGDRTKNFSHGLRNLIEPRDHVGICAANRPEWMIADFACVLHSFITVPIYCRYSDREIIFVMNNTNITTVICDRTMLPTFVRLHSKCPKLRYLICMDPIPDSIICKFESPAIHYMGDIEINGSIKQFQYTSTKPNDCLTMMYTSGTSGFPKGVMISEKLFCSQFKDVCIPYNGERILLSYRPLAWGADRNAVFSVFLYGGRTGFSTGDISRLMEEIALVRPTSFSSSPSVWNKIYSEFKCELSLAVNYRQMNPDEAEQELRNKFSKLMPNRCKTLAIGGAMVSSVLLKSLNQCFPHCLIIESYGSTECGGITFDNSFCSGVVYRLESVPEMGYTTDDRPFPRGELLVKTMQMFSGYMNNPEETKAAVTDDGFFRTGDIVELQFKDNEEPKVYIIDRKKNFFKLANSQFISPEFLQGIYIQSPFIEQIYIHGNPMDNYTIAVIVPNKEYAHTFAKNHNLIEFDMKNPDTLFIDALMNDIRSIAAKESLGKHEIPSRLIIDFEPFTAENGLLTSSLKPCRHKLAEHYADRLKDHRMIEERLKDILEIITGQQLLTDKPINLTTIGGHSLAAVRMSHMIHDELGVEVPLDVLFEPQMSLEQLANLIKDPSQISLSSGKIFSKITNDAEMEFNIPLDQRQTSIVSPSIIFITGTTGFVGAFLLNELLVTYPSPCKFICLVRCNKSSNNPFDRIYQNMSFLHLWKDEYLDRIVALQGDLAEDKFGLDDQTYDKLAQEIDLIFHCGAIVNFILPYSQLYGSNVIGTREIIRLASYTSTCVPVHYISTLNILPLLSDDHTISSNGYTQSKWVAEKLMMKASHAGLPVIIYRLGLILADTGTGACNPNDFYTLLVAAILKTKCYPSEVITASITGIPANVATRNIIDLSRNAIEKYGNIYEIVDNQIILSFERSFDCIRKYDLQIESITYNEWRKKIISDSIGEFLPENPFKLLIFLHQLNNSSLHDDYISKWINFLLNNFVYSQ